MTSPIHGMAKVATKSRTLVVVAAVAGSGVFGERPRLDAANPTPTLTTTPPNPVADPSAIVFCDAISRFTVLMGADGVAVVRAETSANGRFEDRASFAFVNRRLPVPDFTVSNSTDVNGWCNITVVPPSGKENAYVFSYRKRALGSSSKSTLEQHGFRAGSTAHNVSWADGGAIAGALGGTVYHLSGCNGTSCLFDETGPLDLTCGGKRSTSDNSCGAGVLTTSGVGVMSDSDNNVVTADGWWDYSVHAQKHATDQDIYVFVYGSNYRAALSALAAVSGKMLPPPRRFFGVWWSRWSKYSQQGLREITQIYESNGIPLDGINLDTEWHRSSNYIDCCNDASGKKLPTKAWYSGVFDYERSLYPDPVAMADWLGERGLWPVWSDIHQADGVSSVNTQWRSFAADVGVSQSDSGLAVAVDNRTYMAAFFKMLGNQTPTQSYWWPDNPEVGLSQLNGFNPVLWNRWQLFLDAEQRGLRPTVMGPFGGLGTQRFPFMHSGDIITSWATLKFLVRYTYTAGNILISYITHDVGGHRDYGHGGNDPELYTRFVQYCTYTAMLRPHPQRYPAPDSGDSRIERRIWVYPYTYFDAMRASMRTRSRLLPYTYTAAMLALISDVPLIRGLYVDWPSEAHAYNETSGMYHFMFGESILVAPIFTAMTPLINLTLNHPVFLPPLPPTGGGANVWVERHSGRCLTGGMVHRLNFTLDEFPVYVKAGTVLPTMLEPSRAWRSAAFHPISDDEPPALLGSASDPSPKTVVWETYLGNATMGNGVLIEDDGNSTGYATGATATTTASFFISGPTLRLSVDAVVGKFPSMRVERHYEWRVMNVLSPVSVIGATAWDWDADTLSTRVIVRNADVTKNTTVTITFAAATPPISELLCSPSGHAFPATSKRVRQVKHAVDVEGPNTLSSIALNALDSTTQRMANTPATAAAELAQYRAKVAATVHLHTTPLADGSGGLPSPELQAWLAARLA